MPRDKNEWRPGSFTKNFGWGRDPSVGLIQLYDVIRLGFDGKIEDVPRALFRGRVAAAGRPDFIPINFFLFNKVIDGVDHLVVDELVFHALSFRHTHSFDRLALFAFNLSMVGQWSGAADYQRYPALWSHFYISDRVGRDLGWDARKISADDIENFIFNDPRYHAKSARKLSTNLNHLYKIGHLSSMGAKVERWWVDCLFLALDRITEDRAIKGQQTQPQSYQALLDDFNFLQISGKPSLEKNLAVRHLSNLYTVCGGRDRFSDEEVRSLTALRLPDVDWLIANDARPQGAVHPTNPAILKSIPRACAMLAKYAGFDVLDADELENFNPEEFVREKTKAALHRLQAENVKPIMTSEELMRLTRGE